jgi:UDP-N-acetylbacillosamine N-acetyltransferase
MNASDRKLYVYGAGGHGLVVAESAVAAGWEVAGFLDEQPQTTLVGRWRVYPSIPAEAAGQAVAVAVGDNMARRRLTADIAQTGLQLTQIIHPTAWVSPTAILGRGVFIGPQAVINGQANIEDGVIINSSAVVEHHCVVGGYSHVAPRAVLCGNVRVGEMCLIGAGATVKPGIAIGDDCTVGVGAAVVSDLDHNQTVVGVPARPINSQTGGDFRLAQ